MFRLMIKKHNFTGMQYLCITKREKWEEYPGSGSYWTNHLKKYGNDISTQLLFESENYEEFLIQCYFYSDLLDVVKSNSFANMVPEYGYDGDPAKETNNLVLWWQNASEEAIQAVINKRKIKQKENHWTRGNNKDRILKLIEEGWEFKLESIREKLSIAGKEYWKQFSEEEKLEKLKPFIKGRKSFYEDKDSDRYKSWYVNMTTATAERMKSTPFDILSERSRKARLELSPEKKLARKEKFVDAVARGSYIENAERMKIERVGIGNPAAKITVWMGQEYTATQFKKLKLDKSYVDQMILERQDCYRKYTESMNYAPVLHCTHCGKSTDPKATSTSTFKRWHMDNCKHKK